MSSSSSVSSASSTATAGAGECNSDTPVESCVSNTVSSSNAIFSLTHKTCKQRPTNSPVKPSSPLFKISSVKCWEDAKSQSFYARDNVTNFIKWCRFLGVREAVIFETEDLVLHNNQRNVILCLLEVARIICTKYGYTIVPGLVEFEKEIDRQIEREEQLHMQLTAALDIVDEKKTVDDDQEQSTDQNNDEEKKENTCNPLARVEGELIDAIDGQLNVKQRDDSLNVTIDQDAKTLFNDEESQDEKKHKIIDETIAVTVITPSPCASLISLTSTGGECESSVCSPIPCESLTNQSIDSYNEVNTSRIMGSQLDQKVMLIAKSFYGKKAKQGIQRLEEGKYRIAGKIVFVRVSSLMNILSFTRLSLNHVRDR